MSKIYAIRNTDTGEFYGDAYKGRFCKPAVCVPSDYSAWTTDIGEVVHYKDLKSAKSSAKRLDTEFKKVIAELDAMIAGCPDWQNSKNQIEIERPSKSEGVEITVGILSVTT